MFVKIIFFLCCPKTSSSIWRNDATFFVSAICLFARLYFYILLFWIFCERIKVCGAYLLFIKMIEITTRVLPSLWDPFLLKCNLMLIMTKIILFQRYVQYSLECPIWFQQSFAFTCYILFCKSQIIIDILLQHI